MSAPASRSLSLLVEDAPTALARITALCARRRFAIEALEVTHAGRPGVHRVTLTFGAGNRPAARLDAHLDKLVEVLDVTERPAP
ncbi:ACT domain-containing protein [Streptomyces sp. NPDC038707]|uniref:ACT domain-containing protein n=1 Tax=unclassified Streptomyces TaxID=2593676 RepID=UPI0033F1FEE0